MELCEVAPEFGKIFRRKLWGLIISDNICMFVAAVCAKDRRGLPAVHIGNVFLCVQVS